MELQRAQASQEETLCLRVFVVSFLSGTFATPAQEDVAKSIKSQ